LSRSPNEAIGQSSLACSLFQADPRPAAVLCDELNAGLFEGRLQPFARIRPTSYWLVGIYSLTAPDRWLRYSRGCGEIILRPTQYLRRSPRSPRSQERDRIARGIQHWIGCRNVIRMRYSGRAPICRRTTILDISELVSAPVHIRGHHVIAMVGKPNCEGRRRRSLTPP
jgi:hypothetical protein